MEYYSGNHGEAIADTLIYSGALTYHANFDAVNYFLHDIFPLIQKECPDARLYITGSLEGVPLDQLPENDAVAFTGYLDDIRPAIARSWISIVPLRVGGGTRLKILEAMALGTPVVATSKGAEGLELIPDHDIVLADTPATFAESVLSLLNDPARRLQLSAHGRRIVSTKYTWQKIGQQFIEFVESYDQVN